jgi:hypothetical protein
MIESYDQVFTSSARPSVHKFSTLTSSAKLHFVVELYKFTLPKYNINNTRFAGLEICAIGKKAHE